MSSFPGTTREYPLISIDRFDGKNLESTVYFLSHNHADHTIGLDQPSFHYRLSSNNNIKLYCSIITKELLLLDNKYKSLKNNIVGLEVNEPCPVPIMNLQTGKEEDQVTVTLLPAEHSPGSVMMLFEGSEGTVLYTGDFRLSKTDLINMSHLHSGSCPKKIKSLYADTTFCVPQALYIPGRDESIQAIIDIVQEWISQSEQHVINMKHKAALGYEDLFKSLCLRFKMKVHVHPTKYKQYEKVADMAEYTTPDPSVTQIHACRWTKNDVSSPLPCGYMPKNCTELHLRSIKVSTMVFVQSCGLDVYAKRFSEKYFRVCYSFHSSYSEVRDMVLYLQPERAFPNVVPPQETMERIQHRIDQFVELAKKNILSSSPDQYKALGKLKVRKRRRTKLSQQSNKSSDLHFGDIGESPIKSKRHKLNSSVEQDSVKNKAAGDFGSEFPLLCGDLKSDGDSLELSQDTGKRSAAAEEAGSTDYDSLVESDDDISLLLSQEDRNNMENFSPKLPGVYGLLLGYISEDDSDEETNMDQRSLDDIKSQGNKSIEKQGSKRDNTECVLPNKCMDRSVNHLVQESTEEQGLEITACNLPNIHQDSSNTSLHTPSLEKQALSFVLPNGRIDLAASTTDPKPEIGMPSLEILACVLPNGRIDLEDKMTDSSNSLPGANYSKTDDKVLTENPIGKRKSQGYRSSKDCKQTRSRSHSGSSSLEEMDGRKANEAKLRETKDCQDVSYNRRNTSGDSGDVILLEDDDCTTKKSSTVISPDKATDNNLPSTLDSEATSNCSREAGKACGNVSNSVPDGGGKGAADDVVMCTIDLTELDEEEEVYPSTSALQPPLYGYHGQNLFSRFNHPAMLHGAIVQDDEDIEYSEKEVQCSDDECECGGKPNGGTHKYLVPRPKKVISRPPAQQVNWVGENEGSDDENLLEQPAHVRTRKWIESQSRYMQRRNFLNSQPVPSSEVIVIDSDDEVDGNPEGTNNKDEDKTCCDSLLTGNNSKHTLDERQANGKDETARNLNEKESNEKDEASSLQNRDLSADLSPTSCPTNLSLLAQASDPSLKSAIVNDAGQIVKMVNGAPSDHADTNELDSKAPTDVDDKESAS